MTNRTRAQALRSIAPKKNFDYQNEADFRHSIDQWSAIINSVMSQDPLGPSGIPITYDPTSDVLTVSANVEITGDSFLDGDVDVDGMLHVDGDIDTDSDITADGDITGNILRSLTLIAAPLVVASSILVTNLNADKLDGQHGSYYQDASNLNAGNLAYARLPTGGGTWANGGALSITGGFTTVAGLVTTNQIIPDATDTRSVGISGTGFQTVMIEHGANRATGLLLRQTNASDASPRIMMENTTSWAGSGVTMMNDAANRLRFSTNAAIGSSSGTDRFYMTDAALYPATALQLGLTGNRWGAAWMGAVTATTGAFSGQMVLSLTTDIGGGSASTSALVIGDIVGTHLAFDGNEIMAKASATTTSVLAINADGGNVSIGNNRTTENTDLNVLLKSGDNAGANTTTNTLDWAMGSTSRWRAGMTGSVNWRLLDIVNNLSFLTVAPSSSNVVVTINSGTTTGSVDGRLTINAGTAAGVNNRDSVIEFGRNGVLWREGVIGSLAANANWTLRDAVSNVSALIVTATTGAATFINTVTSTEFLGPTLDSGSAVDLVLQRNNVTNLTLGASSNTFVGTVLPSTNGSVDLGTSAARWREAFAITIDSGASDLTLQRNNVSKVVFGSALATFPGTTDAPTALIYSTSNAGLSAANTVLRIQHQTGGDMADGFGPQIDFEIRDSAAVDNVIARIGVTRSNADDTQGKLALTYGRSIVGMSIPSMFLWTDSANLLRMDINGRVKAFLPVYGVNTAANITSDQNNYALNVTGGITRLSSDATRTITGIAAGEDGEVRTLVNVGSNWINLSNLSASSSSANQIITGSGATYTLTATESVTMWYDGISTKWRIL